MPTYDPSLYATARIEVVAPDGAMIPVSLVFRKDLVQLVDGAPLRPTALHLYGYGAYGAW